jgi:hypothetical protein
MVINIQGVKFARKILKDENLRPQDIEYRLSKSPYKIEVISNTNVLLNLVDYQITAVRDNIIVDSTNFTLTRGGN